MRNVTSWEALPARPARVVPFPGRLDPWLASRLQQRGISQLYTHQGAAWEAAQAHQHFVVVTPTASGKTLCYNLAVLDQLRRSNDATALYLFPTKALAQDQLAELQSLLDRSPDLPVAIYDGDTPHAARKTIRTSARVLISNPDMLHTGILPHHTRWARFLSQLRFVVIDELHTYRGIFGSHFANVLRRLKRVCRFYGSHPQFVCSSATIANPLQLAEMLIEEPLELITDNGAPRGEKHFIFYNPPIVDWALGIRRSTLLETRDLAGDFLQNNVQTIVFARSRLSTEILLTYLRDRIAALGQPVERVQGYRGGYLPSRRREIERGLRSGEVRGVVATNALELGIDIGQLEACIMAGYPGTIASAWQQAGRAGRSSGEAVAILLASSSPLDQYLITHPGYFFGRSPEHGLIDPNNLNILVNHIQCAAFELPFADGERFGRFTETDAALQFLEEEQIIRHTGRAWHWMSETYPAEGISLRTSDANNFLVQAAEGERVHVIGAVDAFSAPLLVHEGAIYLHEGQQYEVTQLDWEAHRARVRPVEVDYYTDASQAVEIRVLDCFAQTDDGKTSKAHGEVLVSALTTGYKKVKLYTHEILGWGDVRLPPQEMHTTAYWLSIGETLVETMREQGIWRTETYFSRGPNWDEQRNLARQRDGFRCRHCGTAETPGHPHHVHHIRPFREFGYVPGRNENYIQANVLGNLATLCPVCHHRAEAGQALRSVLAALAHLIRNVAPIFLMCDVRDLSVVTEAHATFNGLPTLFVYDGVPSGIGLSRRLYEIQGEVLAASLEQVQACPCERGCPSCVGPVTPLDEDIKERVRKALGMIL